MQAAGAARSLHLPLPMSAKGVSSQSVQRLLRSPATHFVGLAQMQR